jgi:hypothetical protein
VATSQEPSFPQPERAPQPAGTPPGLPDLNEGKYPFGVVFSQLELAAYLNTYAVPKGAQPNQGWAEGERGNFGMPVSCALHRFRVSLQQPSSGGLRAINTVGEVAGKLNDRWVIIPDGFSASPTQEPPPTALDPSRSQRFAMQKSEFVFGDGKDGFWGFGTGRTYPMQGGRSRLFAGAVGDIIKGYGRFRDLRGTYVLSGEVNADQGFRGNIQCRIIDPEGRLNATASLPALEPVQIPTGDITYILFHGQKKDSSEQTSYILGPNAQPQGFKLGQELRVFDIDFSAHGRLGLKSNASVGPVVGAMTSQVFLNILAPGAPGTSLAPIPFTSLNQFSFTDSSGKIVGGFVAEGGEGRTFQAVLAGAPGQPALRFGAFQNVVRGTGWLIGAQGLMTDNSIVGVSPHVTMTLYTLCINDPEGKYRVVPST